MPFPNILTAKTFTIPTCFPLPLLTAAECACPYMCEYKFTGACVYCACVHTCMSMHACICARCVYEFTGACMCVNACVFA